MDRGDFVNSRKFYQASLDARAKLAESEAAGESRTALAQLSVEEGRPDLAVPTLRESLTQFRKEQQTDDKLITAAALIRALVADGKYADAVAEGDQEKSSAASSQNRISRLTFSLSFAPATAIPDHPENAIASPNNILKEARQFGLLRLELDLELAVADLEEKAGHHDAAQTHLAALLAKASSHGFGRIQHKAELLH
jgi:hypothetical protein